MASLLCEGEEKELFAIDKNFPEVKSVFVKEDKWRPVVRPLETC